MKRYNYSFIIPHHNSPELLNLCLESIPQRDDIQIIVVDDNSAEDKRPCIKRDDVEVIYIDAEHTKGAGRARNYGLKAAKGKWLLFADCDDYYNVGFLKVLDRYKESDIDVLYFGFDYKHSLTGMSLHKGGLMDVITTYDGSKEKSDFVRFRNNTPWTKMISNKFVQENSIKFEETINGNDIMFSLLVGQYADKIEVTSERLYTYLLNEGSLVNGNFSKQAMLCKIIHKYQCQSFYRYIGHNDWCENMMVFLLYKIRLLKIKDMIQVIYYLVNNRSDIRKKEVEWIKSIIRL